MQVFMEDHQNLFVPFPFSPLFHLLSSRLFLDLYTVSMLHSWENFQADTFLPFGFIHILKLS